MSQHYWLDLHHSKGGYCIGNILDSGQIVGPCLIVKKIKV